QPEVAGRLRGVRSSPIRDILALTEQPGVISFAGGLPAPELFDTAGLRESFAAVLSDGVARSSLQYSTTEGHPGLRARVAARLSARGSPTEPDELLICSGSQQALTLTATTLLEPGDVVLTEEPSYLAALQCFGLAGARTIGVACDDEGIDPEALESALIAHRPKALYLIPSFQNPTGRTLPLARRERVADLAARHGLWIIEDDPYSELRYRGSALPAIATLPGADDRTLSLSTLSKTVAPGLRIGWIRTTPELRPGLVIAKQAADLHSSSVDQAAAAHWLGHIDLDAHVARLCAAYGERRDALLGGLAGALPPGSTWNRPDGGMFIWARLPAGEDAEPLLRRALGQGVAFVPGYPFFSGTPERNALRLSFTRHPAGEIAEGLARLRAAWDS
ncbi:MAG: 2-aminoadipate transaminase, partial [Solirubrobacteraceae bacterium]|nr:2-aminoadipate transaminase [Solirubrobacteraceae bacterium]